MNKTKRILSIIATTFALIGLFSLFSSLITNIVCTEGASTLNGIELITNLFNGEYSDSPFYVFLFVVFAFYVLFQLFWLILAFLKLCGVNINKRTLQVISVCVVMFATLTLSAVVTICNKNSVYIDELNSNIYHIGFGTYLLFVSSLIELSIVFTPHTFESTL